MEIQPTGSAQPVATEANSPTVENQASDAAAQNADMQAALAEMTKALMLPLMLKSMEKARELGDPNK